MIVIILWYVSILLSWGWGYLWCYTRTKRRKARVEEPDQATILEQIKAQRESENFWSYDGTEQD